MQDQCDYLLNMAYSIREKQDTLDFIQTGEGSKFSYINTSNFLEAFNLSCFKIIMENENLLYFDSESEKNIFFRYFFKLYKYIKTIQEELEKFLTSKKSQQLFKDLNNNKQTINDFLKKKLIFLIK